VIKQEEQSFYQPIMVMIVFDYKIFIFYLIMIDFDHIVAIFDDLMLVIVFD
jgi:pyoverdine/dityrosine biosynthesis protein Dit1